MGMAVNQPSALDYGLTRREIDILELVAEDMTTVQIAAVLGISFRTVEQHRASISKRLGCKTAAGAMVKALRAGLIRW